MLKCIDPEATQEYSHKLAPDTVFTYTAMSGVLTYINVDDLSRKALRKFVKKVTNIEVVEVETSGEGDKKVETRTRKQYEEFIPSDHPKVDLFSQLPYEVATGLFSDMWNFSKLSWRESGE